MATAAGWFSDPYGRYEQRYWDGTAWTEHVSTAGTQTTDPLGETTVIPIVTPETAFVPQSSTTPVAVARTPRTFLDSLGPDARTRPAPQLSLALAGAGGALVALGITALFVGDSGSRASAFVSAFLILAGALAIRLVVPGQPDLKSAAVGGGVVGLFVLGGAIVFDGVGQTWALFIFGVLFVVAWILPGFRGRSIMLGIGTLFMVATLASATAGDGGSSEDQVWNDIAFPRVSGGKDFVFLLAAAVLLVLVWRLDRAGYFGIGTSLVVAAIISAFVGVGEASGRLDNTGAAVLIFAVGLFVCFVGGHGRRRATTWWGALLATIGVVGFFGSVMTPTSVGSVAAVLLISGALLTGGPAAVRAIRAAQTKGDSTPLAQPGPGSTPPSSPAGTGSLPPPSV